MQRFREKSLFKRILAVVLGAAIVFNMLPVTVMATETQADDTSSSSEETTEAPAYSEADYTYMYLVTTKKDNWQCQEWGKGGYHTKKYYDKFSYTYDSTGLVAESTRKSDRPNIKTNKTGQTSYEYEDGNLISVDGPLFSYSYSYDDKGRINKYDMMSREITSGWKGPNQYTHKLKYASKDKSIYNPRCAGVPSLSSGDKYFFSKNGKVKKMYCFKNYRKKYSWLEKIYYSYDKKGNLSKIKTTDQELKTTDTAKYKNTYKSGRLTKRKKTKPSVNDIASTTYKYKKVKILKKYKKQVQEQQWRILNFDDLHDFGINMPWKY